MDSRYVHVHADTRRSPVTVHDRHGGDDIDQGGCQPAVQRPSPVSVLLLNPHLTHHFTWSSRQNVHLRKKKHVRFYLTKQDWVRVSNEVPGARVASLTGVHIQKLKMKCGSMCLFTLLSTLSKPGLSTMALIICFREFKDRETIFNPTTRHQCQTCVYFEPEMTAFGTSSG